MSPTSSSLNLNKTTTKKSYTLESIEKLNKNKKTIFIPQTYYVNKTNSIPKLIKRKEQRIKVKIINKKD